MLSSLIYTDNDIACYDKDGDGYYNWGVVADRPVTCPNDLPVDGDDNNALYGPRDEYGNLVLIGDLSNVTIGGNEVIGTGATYMASGLPEGAQFTHWSYSTNLTSADYSAENLSVSVKEDNGLASIILHFTYNGKAYKTTRLIPTSEDQLVFVEQRNSLPPAVTSTYSVADFDMDEDYDLVYSGRTAYDYARLIGGYPSWDDYYCYYFENNNGFIRDTSRIPYTGGQEQSMDINDLNNDLIPDFSLFAYNAFKEDWHYNYNKIFYSGGDFFSDHILDLETLGITSLYESINWIDYNNDGALDIGTLYSNFSFYSFIDSSFLSFRYTDTTSCHYLFTAGDFDNDGKAELISIPNGIYNPEENENLCSPDDAFLSLWDDVANHPDSLSLLSSLKIGLPDVEYSYYPEARMETADFNNDGYLDVLVSYDRAVNGGLSGGALTLYMNNGNNGFSSHLVKVDNTYEDALGSIGLVIGDFTNDNFPDILYSGMTVFDGLFRRLYLLVNDGSGGFIPQLINSSGVESGSSLNAADFDHDGNLDFLIS